MKRYAIALSMLALGGCHDDPTPAAEPNASATAAATIATASASGTSSAAGDVTITIAYGSEKKTWLEEQAAKFGETHAKTKAGHAIKIKLTAEGSGEAVQGIVSGEQKPTVVSPASTVYLALLNQQWETAKATAKPIAPASEPLVLSPVVVAIWKPMAEALGWPKKTLGWSDLLKVDADPRGWGALQHPEWGRFKLGHTHPQFSSSGLLSILAEAYAGAKKTRELSEKDLDDKATVKFFTKVEQTIVHYGKSTGFFADKMVERGPSYLSAAILYENLVIESYAKQPAFPIVALYPVEGTFWSDHPYAILDAEWVKPEEHEAAEAFLQFLKDKPQQERAMALGFRPADPAIAMSAPIDADHGVDPKQPSTLLQVPPPATLQKLLHVWESEAKRASSVELCFDKSGSMTGKPMNAAKQGATSFVDMLRDRDELSLWFFDAKVYPAFGPKKIATGKQELESRIGTTIAEGGTALYDCVATALDAAKKGAAASPERIHAVVVMTDGKDENSKLPFPDLLKKEGSGESDSPLKVFTIAYGDEADQGTLKRIADGAKGTSLVGKPETIVDVYKEMASFF